MSFYETKRDEKIATELVNIKEAIINLTTMVLSQKQLAKPPLGVMPKIIWMEKRIEALNEAIARRQEFQNGFLSPHDELFVERNGLIDDIELINRMGGQHR